MSANLHINADAAILGGDPIQPYFDALEAEAHRNVDKAKRWATYWTVVTWVLGLLAAVLAAAAGVTLLPTLASATWVTAVLGFGAALVSGLTAFATPAKRAADNRTAEIGWWRVLHSANDFALDFGALSPPDRQPRWHALVALEEEVMTKQYELSAQSTATLKAS